MISLLVSIIALGAIITIHEAGHFLASRACGVGVIEFSIGMGPRLLSKLKGRTRYSLRAVPFGGSCMLLGEESEENGAFENDSVSVDAEGITIDGVRFSRSEQFVTKKAWQRFIIIFAGPAFNFILAFILSLGLTAAFGTDRPVITEVTAGMPAAEAGIAAGDEIYALECCGHRMTVETARDIQVFMTVHEADVQDARPVTIFYRDADDGMAKKQAELLPVYDEENQRFRTGFSYSVACVKADNPAEVLKFAVYNVNYCIRSAVESIRMIMHGRVTRQDVAGPVRMVAVMDEAVNEASDYGLSSAAASLADMMILISATLGFMNLLPLPALDGGRLIFIIIEMITRHAVPKKFEARIHMAGMLILLALMFLIMANDISLLLTGH